MSSVDEYGRDSHRRGRSPSRRSHRDRSPSRRRSRSHRRRYSPSQSRSRERSRCHHRSRSPRKAYPSMVSKREVPDDFSEDESGREDDDDVDTERYTSRAKKLKRIDVELLLLLYEHQITVVPVYVRSVHHLQADY